MLRTSAEGAPGDLRPRATPDAHRPCAANEPAPAETIAVIGAGSIGIAWAAVYASAGLPVRLYEVDPATRARTIASLGAVLRELAAAGLLDPSIARVLERVTVCDTLHEALPGAALVQECIVEDLSAKRALFAQLDRLSDPDAVLASSSSTMTTTQLAADLAGRERCIVVHPGNPPYVLRVAEVVPAAFTAQASVGRAQRLLRRAGMTPVLLTREIEGFAFNRLQGAVLQEAWRLVRDGVVSPEGIDTLVRDGLGLQWSALGPIASFELGPSGGFRPGATSLDRRLGPFIGTADGSPWQPETIARVSEAVTDRLPHGTWEENVRARDHAMISLAARLRPSRQSHGDARTNDARDARASP